MDVGCDEISSGLLSAETRCAVVTAVLLSVLGVDESFYYKC